MCRHVLYTVRKPICMAIQRNLNRTKRTSCYRVMLKIAPDHRFWKQFCKSLYACACRPSSRGRLTRRDRHVCHAPTCLAFPHHSHRHLAAPTTCGRSTSTRRAPNTQIKTLLSLREHRGDTQTRPHARTTPPSFARAHGRASCHAGCGDLSQCALICALNCCPPHAAERSPNLAAFWVLSSES